MPKRSNTFQKLVKLVYDTYSSVENCKIEESALLKNSLGVKREIDILIEREIFGHKLMVAIECRDHKRKADIKWIDELIGKYEDLPIDKILAVSKTGFYKNAKKMAAKVGIETLELENAHRSEWERKLELLLIYFIKTELKLIDASISFEPVINFKISAEEKLYNREGKILGNFEITLKKYFENNIVPRISDFLYSDYFPKCKGKDDFSKIKNLHVLTEMKQFLVKLDEETFSELKEVVFKINVDTKITSSDPKYYKFGKNILLTESSFLDDNKEFKVHIVQNTQSGTIVSMRDIHVI